MRAVVLRAPGDVGVDDVVEPQIVDPDGYLVEIEQPA